MSEHEHDGVTDEQVADEIDEAREDDEGGDEQPQPWAKTSSGDAETLAGDS